MNSPSATFAASRRVHVSFPTRDLGAARQFYEALFGVPAFKVKEDYVKFSCDEPSLNFSLTATGQAFAPTRAHYGIEVKSGEEVSAYRARLQAAGIEVGELGQPTCCYSEQTKFWVEDPDGNSWEIFSVIQDAAEFGERTKEATSQEAEPDRCCAPDCCT